MPRFTYQVLLGDVDAETDDDFHWYYPNGLYEPRPEFASSTEALQAATQRFPGKKARAAFLGPSLGYMERDFAEPHQVIAPIGSVRAALWSLVRGISCPTTWRAKCSSCGETGQAHHDPWSILICRRFRS